MDHLLNLSTAAKLAGVSRRIIQSRIRTGELETFEGHVRMSALSKVYPEVAERTDAVLERMERIQDNALHKINPDEISDERVLASQVHRLQTELTDTYAQLDSYRMLTAQLHDRLQVMKEQCDRKDKQMIQALLHWMVVQMKQHV
jgi:CDP-4-dehydro-6-deoxyglucose reductase